MVREGWKWKDEGISQKDSIISSEFTIRITSKPGRRSGSRKPFMPPNILRAPSLIRFGGIHQGQEFIPGWGTSWLLTGTIGSSTLVGQKSDRSSATAMAVRSNRTTSSPPWTPGPLRTLSRECGTEWRLHGGAGPQSHRLVGDGKTETTFVSEQYIKLFSPNLNCSHDVVGMSSG